MKTHWYLPIYESKHLVRDAQTNPRPERPVRYCPVDFAVTFWRKIFWLFKYRRWITGERHFLPIYPGSPGYEEAPYESMKLK